MCINFDCLVFVSLILKLIVACYMLLFECVGLQSNTVMLKNMFVLASLVVHAEEEVLMQTILKLV